MTNIENLAVNTIRTLSVDQVQQANSGHPGMPLGAAPIAYSVWANHLEATPNHTDWINRDRFILSSGHASAMLYSLLHLFGYKLTIEDLKGFRQLNSLTPGHPEYGHTDGVEATTGPLGAGLSMAVGMAMASEHLAAKYNRPNYPIIDNYTYVLAGDGCMMEGITSESSSLAGTLALGRLIIIYDSNNITIEGETDLAFHENVRERYEAYGFETFLVEDGNDLFAINEAIEKAKANLDKPSFIEVRTKIGYMSTKEGSAGVHGAPLGEENVTKLKQALKYPSLDPFYVAPEVYDHYQSIVEENDSKYDAWMKMFNEYTQNYPDLKNQWDKDFKELTEEELLANTSLFEFENKPIATRSVSGILLNRLNESVGNLFGGSADLAPSNMTHLNNEASFSAKDYSGKNIHFGVRELAMAAVGNGISLFGGLKSYVATFFVFADYLKPMARLSSLMSVPLTYVLTHDSIGVGEDGPTHEPVEQLTMLRAMPNFINFRPADAKETAYGWVKALTSKDTPVGLILSRQNLPQLENTGVGALKGAYVIKDSKNIDLIILASGSEVSLALDAAQVLEEKGKGVRVVSVPSLELFEMQSVEYKESVLPNNISNRVVIEAGSSMSWGRYVGINGTYITIDTFGASGKGNELFEYYGFTVDNVVETILK